MCRNAHAGKAAVYLLQGRARCEARLSRQVHRTKLATCSAVHTVFAAGVGALRGTLEPLWRVPAYEKDLQFYLGAFLWQRVLVAQLVGAGTWCQQTSSTRSPC